MAMIREIDAAAPVLQADGLVQEFRAPWRPFRRRPPARVLDAVSLAVPAGGSLAVVGAAGAGKSVLAAILIGRARPTAGKVRLLGEDPARHARDRARLTERVGIVFGDPFRAFNPRQRIAAAVAEPLVARHGARDGHRAPVEAILRAVGFGARGLLAYPDSLTGEERQRAALARALVATPPLLLLDEPTTGLAPEEGIAILNLIRSLQEERGFAVLALTRDRWVADYLAQTVLRLADGRLAPFR